MKRTALITGASAGIGRAVSVSLSQLGFNLVINARRQEKLEELKQELRSPCHIVAGDAAKPEVIEQLFREGTDTFSGGVDLVIVNAGFGLGGSVAEADLGKLDQMLQLNLGGAIRLMQTAAQHMKKDLKTKPFPAHPHDIVVLGSTVGRHISPFSAVYGATKFGVNSLAEALRRELGPLGIRVTLIEPGIVLSEFQDQAGYAQSTVDGFKDRFGPLLLPEDIAEVISFIVTRKPHVHINDAVIRSVRQDYP